MKQLPSAETKLSTFSPALVAGEKAGLASFSLPGLHAHGGGGIQ